MSLAIESMAIELPAVNDHPNRVGFRGVLTVLDVPSDRPPAGARGHRVLLTRAAAERALPSLLGMGLDYTPGLDRHDVRRKVGVITEANIVPARVEPTWRPADKKAASNPALAVEGKALKAAAPGGKARSIHAIEAAGVKPGSSRLAAGGPNCARIEIAGYLFARDFPEIVHEMRSGRSALGMSYEIADARIDDVRAGIWTVNECTFTGAAVLRRDKAAYASTWIELIG